MTATQRAPNRQGAEAVCVDVPAGTRIVWLLNPRTEFYTIVRNAFPLQRESSVLYTDMLTAHGSRTLGEYELAW
jgi:hypothetical protein